MLWGFLFLGSLASSSTGGVTAIAGQVVTTGDSYAHSSVTNVINSDDSGGTSVVDIETDSDGEVKHEHIEKSLKPGESSVVSVSATATSSGTSIVNISTTSTVLPEVRRNISELFFGHRRSSAVSPSAASTTEQIEGVGRGIFAGFSHFFGHVWSLFGFPF